jgi:hypothetical protein
MTAMRSKTDGSRGKMNPKRVSVKKQTLFGRRQRELRQSGNYHQAACLQQAVPRSRADSRMDWMSWTMMRACRCKFKGDILDLLQKAGIRKFFFFLTPAFVIFSGHVDSQYVFFFVEKLKFSQK